MRKRKKENYKIDYKRSRIWTINGWIKYYIDESGYKDSTVEWRANHYSNCAEHY